MPFLTSVFLVFSLRNCSADEPNSLGLEAANIHFYKKTIKSWIYSIPTDKPDSNYRKALQMPHNLPSWVVCYGESPLLKNRLYQKRKTSSTIPQNIVDCDCSSNRRLRMKHEQAAASGTLNWNNNMLSKLTNHILAQFSRDWYHAHIAICMRTINWRFMRARLNSYTL